MSWSDTFQLIFGIFASSGIAVAIMFGLSSWLGKVWAGRILQTEKVKFEKELERIKAEYAKKHTVHRLQFQKEFDLYEKLWESLVNMSITCDIFSPSIQMASVTMMGN
jgi:hypothetical protein